MALSRVLMSAAEAAEGSEDGILDTWQFTAFTQC